MGSQGDSKKYLEKSTVWSGEGDTVVKSEVDTIKALEELADI